MVLFHLAAWHRVNVDMRIIRWAIARCLTPNTCTQHKGRCSLVTAVTQLGQCPSSVCERRYSSGVQVFGSINIGLQDYQYTWKIYPKSVRPGHCSESANEKEVLWQNWLGLKGRCPHVCLCEWAGTVGVFHIKWNGWYTRENFALNLYIYISVPCKILQRFRQEWEQRCHIWSTCNVTTFVIRCCKVLSWDNFKVEIMHGSDSESNQMNAFGHLINFTFIGLYYNIITMKVHVGLFCIPKSWSLL